MRKITKEVFLDGISFYINSGSIFKREVAFYNKITDKFYFYIDALSYEHMRHIMGEIELYKKEIAKYGR